MEQLLLKKKHQDQHFITRTLQSSSNPSSVQPPLAGDRNISGDEPDADSITPVPSIYNVFYTNQDKGEIFVQPTTNIDSLFDHCCPSHVSIEELHELTAPVATIAKQDANSGRDENMPSLQNRKGVMSTRKEDIKVEKRVQSVAHPKRDNAKGKKTVTRRTQRSAKPQVVEQPIPTTVPGIEESLRLAWRAKQQAIPHDLSSFFYPSSRHEQDDIAEESLARELDSSHSLPVPALLALVPPTAWIPGSSVSDGHASSSQADIDSSLQHISYSDLPPPSSPTPNLTQHHDANDSGDESNDRLSPYSVEDESGDKKQWAAADDSALEELACELASTTARDVDADVGGDMGREVWSRMTTEQLAEDFEEYQNRVMDEDDYI